MPSTPGALLLTCDAQIVEIDLPAADDKHLAVMHAVLRCTAVDVVALTDQLDMWIDDEGLYNHRSENLSDSLACFTGVRRPEGWSYVASTGV